MALVKAKLLILDSNGQPVNQGFEVQFNPESVKLGYSNQLTEGKPPVPPLTPKQFVGKGSTKLSVQLVFDTTRLIRGDNNQGEGLQTVLNEQGKGVSQSTKDVRKLTRKIIDLITPKKLPARGADQNYAPPMVRFWWGTFMFDGLMESLEESLEFFAPEGVPLRATLSLGLVQQKIEFAVDDQAGKPATSKPGSPSRTPGNQPLTAAPTGSNLPSLAQQQGRSDWQSIASANGLEDVRRLKAGQLIDMNASLPSAKFGG